MKTNQILVSSWPLFFGFGLLMVGNGLQGTLLGIRASMEEFDTMMIGLIMSMFYFGFLAGSYYAPKMVSSVGHIRVFTALASLASGTVLLHGLYPDPWLWAIIRLFTGFAYAGLYIVVESWLNNSASNKTRGKMFAIYQIITYGGMAFGQFFLNFADPAQLDLFIITSILVSIALIPIALSSRPAPDFDEPEHLPIKKLFKISPLGLIGCFATGIGTGAVFGLGAVFAADIGMSVKQISVFMAFYIVGGIASQIPIGYLSDKYDRRLVIVGVSLASVLISFVCFIMTNNFQVLNITVFGLGALSLPIYGLCLAHITDHLQPKQFVAGCSSAILANGVGAAIGPLLISVLLMFAGTDKFFLAITAVFFCLFIYAIYRTQRREAVPMDEQGEYASMPMRPTPMSMSITEEGHAIMQEMEDK